MIEEHCNKRKEILKNLRKSNENVKALQEKLKSNSLVKICVIEKTHFSFFKLKKIKVHQKPMPNKALISYFQSVILSLHEEYNEMLSLAHELGELGVHTSKQVSSIVQQCFHIHLHLGALEKQNMEYFERELVKEKESCTLHQAERFIEEYIHDFRILKEEILDYQENECKNLLIPLEQET
jgi:hypothetical protein